MPLLEAQLHSLYPHSAVESHQYGFHDADHEWKDRLCGGLGREDRLFVAPLYLAAPYCFPIRTFTKLANDPLATVIAVMDELGADEWALVQVLFCRAKHSWAENLRIACEDPYRPAAFSDPGPGPEAASAKSYTHRFTLLRSSWPPTPRERWPAWVHWSISTKARTTNWPSGTRQRGPGNGLTTNSPTWLTGGGRFVCERPLFRACSSTYVNWPASCICQVLRFRQSTSCESRPRPASRPSRFWRHP